ncbi:TPA: PAAR domain-containing protein [Enterobacter ludwigii]|uniref:PAAR domain-containing protein n=1 Tax=Enterobacter TaxID=547 RepID=UPI0015F6BAB1|nr:MULTISPECIES: PAAR domain-containing protein [Enterobacter]MBA7772607.1 PAAR domain-containing protein [Enterobacter sp. RHBSTW-00974]MBA7777696.1 PAAR domain-containing protein [Enterobacter sp. RHBSTW-00318]MBA7830751.1 PAAR domain-containing protein [Enterobacter sp. RHBSTW-00340]MBA8040055.1 PAAR domain-containing protein [Enterobacter sp. RHBSTW-00131]MBG0583915.1 PAAR domain-containing protein [Enterobacter ludwigii]
MAVKGYYLFRGDKTRCGGVITEGWTDHQHFDRDMACEGHKVTCGKHPGLYRICGGLDDDIHGKRIAGTLHSYSSCPCKSKFLHSNWDDDYEFASESAVTEVGQTQLPEFPKLPEPIEPEQHAQTAKKKTGIDAGFAIIPYGGTTEAWQRLLFTENPPAGAKELFATLNGPDERYKAGSIMMVVDPNKQDSEQIAHMQAAKARVDAALAPLSIQQANFLFKHKDTIEMFAAAASTASDTYGYSGQATEAAKGYFEQVEKILVEIEKTYKNQYITSGTLIGEQFFVERRRLFGQLDSVLKMFMKHRFMFNEYADLKSALGLSSRSITHRWNETGVSDIEGYATHIEKLAKYVKWMETAGKIGIGLSAFDTAAKITEACTVGRDCAKTSFTSIGEFSGGLVGGAVGARIIGAGAANTICAVVLGAATIEAGGAGALLCTLIVSGGIAYGSDKAFSWSVGKASESIGEALGLYEVTSDD